MIRFNFPRGSFAASPEQIFTKRLLQGKHQANQGTDIGDLNRSWKLFVLVLKQDKGSPATLDKGTIADIISFRSLTKPVIITTIEFFFSFARVQ